MHLSILFLLLERFKPHTQNYLEFSSLIPPDLENQDPNWLILNIVPSSTWSNQFQDILTIILLFLVFGVVIAIGVGLARKITRFILQISKPIAPVVQNAPQAMPYQWVDVTGAQVPVSFIKPVGQTLQQGQQSHMTLAEYTQILEQKVHERTQALEAEIQRRIAIEAILYEANQELERIAFIDGLTQVANRRHFDNYLNQEWWRLKRDKAPLSIILCDLDYFKQYNDTYGHQAGDDCLRRVATALQSAVKRPSDVVTRYGGEEFAVILPDTPAVGAMQVASEIQSAIEQLQLPHPGSLVSPFLTLSLGVASIVPQVALSPQQLIMSADRALYRAKAKGRNSIAIDNLKLETNDRRLA